MSPETHTPLSELVRGWFRRLLGLLADHQVQGLYHIILEQVERVLIEEALLHSGGQLGRAARILSLHRNSLRHRMEQLGMPVRKRSPKKP